MAQIFYPGDDGFEDARVGRIFNGRRPDRQPAAVLFAESDRDVIDGVLLARSRGWPVSVRSGGHSWAAWSVREGALLIDLGRMREMSFDPASGIVSARPAVKGGDELDPFLEEHGRFFNGGHCPSVGIGGFLLQGGQGWLARGWGWATESIVGLDIVTADGELVHASATENDDLFWAARGAGPTFPGIVTRFHLATRPRFAHLGKTTQVYPIGMFAEVMEWVYTMHASVSPDVEIVCVSVTSPDGDRVFVVSAVALTASREASAAALAPFAESPLLDRALRVEHAVDTTLDQQKAEQAAANPEHARYRVDNAWVEGVPRDVIPAIAPLFTHLPTPASFTIWFSMAPLRELPDMAFSLQSEAYVATYLVSDDPALDDVQHGWLNTAMAAAEPVTVGQYLGDSDMGSRQLKVMGDPQCERLQRIIAARDPDSRFVRYLAADPATVNRNHWTV